MFLEKLITALVVVVLFVGIAALCALGSKNGCESAWSDTGLPYRWSFHDECQVQYRGHWMSSGTAREMMLIDHLSEGKK